MLVWFGLVGCSVSVRACDALVCYVLFVVVALIVVLFCVVMLSVFCGVM